MEGITYNIVLQPKCVVELNIKAEWERIKKELDDVYSNLRKVVRMPGFRKGNVPLNIIRDRYSSDAKQEFLGKFTPDVLSEILEKEKINPVTTPKIIDYKLEDNEPFEVNVKVEVYPDIQLKKYKKLKLEQKQYSVEEKDIEKTIDNFRESNASLKVKDGVASDGDYTVVNVRASLDGKEVDLGLPGELLVEIGGNSVLPGFGENIKGMTKGEKKEFAYKFADDFQKEELRGKQPLFNVEVKEIKVKSLPEKEEIVKNLGLESVDQLIENVRKNLEEQVEKASREELEDQIIGGLVDKNDFDIPEGMIEEGVERDKKQMIEYMKTQGGDPEQIDETRIRDKVIREIKAGVILMAIAKQEGVEVSDEDRREEEEKVLKMFRGDNKENREKAKKYVNDNVILTRKVFELVKNNAKVKVVKGDENMGGQNG